VARAMQAPAAPPAPSADAGAAGARNEAPAPTETARARAGEASADRLAGTETMPAPKLGTGHGARESSYVENTQFNRLTDQPNEVIRIRYDSYANLVAMGVIRGRPPVPPSPNAFPDSPPRYVPDPPRYPASGLR
jgi:hypothetical protein